MKKVLLIFLFFFFLFYKGLAQVKTYSGAFKGGKATYHYFERNFERIYEGDFNYISNYSETGSYSHTPMHEYRALTGSFHENKKNGVWNYKIVANHDLGKRGGYNSTQIVTGAYQAGVLNGPWTLKQIDNISKQPIRESSVYFSEGKLIDRFAFKSYIPGQFIEVQGGFDKNGLYDGNWIARYKEHNEIIEDLRKYKNGVLYWELKRNNATGEIIGKLDSSNFVNAFFAKFISEKDSVVINNKGYILKDSGLKEMTSFPNPNNYIDIVVRLWLGHDGSKLLGSYTNSGYAFDNYNPFNLLDDDNSYVKEYTPEKQIIDRNAQMRVDKSIVNTDQQAVTEGDGNAIFTAVELEPEPIGGLQKFYDYLGKKMQYPVAAKEAYTQGKVILQFVVEKDGSLTDIRVLREPGNGLGEEAIRLLKLAPNWKPGIENGKPVRVQFTIPVNFTLGDQ